MFVTPVPRIPSQGRDRQTFTTIDPKTKEAIVTKAMGKTRESGTEVTLKFLIDYNQNKYATGLDELVPNPFYNLEVDEVISKYNLSAKWIDVLPKLLKQANISRQYAFEIADGVDPDYYTSSVKGGTMFNFSPSQLLGKKDSTYIETFSVVFYDRPNRFTDETPRQRMAMQLVKNHNRIAKSKAEANPAEHLFYISEENEAEMEKMRKQDIIDAAVTRKVILQTQASEFMNYKVASLLYNHQDKPIITGVATKDGVKQDLNNYLHNKQFQLEYIDRFNTVMDLLDTKEGKQRFEVKYLIQQGLNTGVLKNTDGYLVWNSRVHDKNIYKWTDLEKFVSFIVSEMLIYDPTVEDPTVTNWYKELFNEVKSKNAWVE